MKHLQKHWRRVPGPARKMIVFVIGWIVIGAGVIMLVIPGPGWATIFVGFAILATEFAAAGFVHKKMTHTLKKMAAFFTPSKKSGTHK